MLTVRGLYDGQNFVAIDSFPKNKSYKVMITFVEEIGENAEIRQFSAQTNSFTFWNDEREDLYQDYLAIEVE